MSAAQKMLIFAAGLIITISLITLGMSLYQSVKGASNETKLRADDKRRQMEESHITQYEDDFITGAQVVGYVKAIVNDVASIPITTAGGTYDAKDATITDLYKKMKKPTESLYYIEPMKRYYVTITRDASEAITSVSVVIQP